jgi:hypothetical protein
LQKLKSARKALQKLDLSVLSYCLAADRGRLRLIRAKHALTSWVGVSIANKIATHTMAIELKQPQSILAAIEEKGVLSGKRIERSETGEPGEFEGMNEQELTEYISQKMVELGIEIVRDEESELSVLSST